MATSAAAPPNKAVRFAAAYVMPRYYEDTGDGVTYRRFFDDAHLTDTE
ncbi:MAG: hypothetical protein ACYCYF_09310 [Anaerolineae bacterium]